MQWSVVGHEEERAYLERHLAAGTLPHALLFEGPSGIGKHLMARDVARALLSDSILPPDSNPDFMQLAPGVDEETGKPKDIGVEIIREQLKPWAYLRPVHGARKVCIIDDCERMGTDAANTLLKVLEEPPRYLVFLLVSGQVSSLLPTIVSRCQHLVMRLLTDAQMREALEGMKLDADDRALLTTVAYGRPGVALGLLESKRLGDVATSIASFERALEGGMPERLILAHQVAQLEHPEEPAQWWLAYVRSRLPERPALVPVAHGLLDLISVLREPHYNRRLALERFWLGLAR
jgi:DNA polymerase-3 subunit delta'